MFARTDRLMLRPGWAEDAPALVRAMAGEVAVRPDRRPWPHSLASAEAWLTRPRATGILPSLLVFLRTAGAPRLIGHVALEERDGGVHLDCWIARPSWGLGYATEACSALTALADHGLRLPELLAQRPADDHASGRVLRKLGFRRLARGGQATDVVTYQRQAGARAEPLDDEMRRPLAA